MKLINKLNDPNIIDFLKAYIHKEENQVGYLRIVSAYINSEYKNKFKNEITSLLSHSISKYMPLCFVEMYQSLANTPKENAIKDLYGELDTNEALSIAHNFDYIRQIKIFEELQREINDLLSALNVSALNGKENAYIVNFQNILSKNNTNDCQYIQEICHQVIEILKFQIYDLNDIIYLSTVSQSIQSLLDGEPYLLSNDFKDQRLSKIFSRSEVTDVDSNIEVLNPYHKKIVYQSLKSATKKYVDNTLKIMQRDYPDELQSYDEDTDYQSKIPTNNQLIIEVRSALEKCGNIAKIANNNDVGIIIHHFEKQLEKDEVLVAYLVETLLVIPDTYSIDKKSIFNRYCKRWGIEKVDFANQSEKKPLNVPKANNVFNFVMPKQDFENQDETDVATTNVSENDFVFSTFNDIEHTNPNENGNEVYTKSNEKMFEHNEHISDNSKNQYNSDYSPEQNQNVTTDLKQNEKDLTLLQSRNTEYFYQTPIRIVDSVMTDFNQEFVIINLPQLFDSELLDKLNNTQEISLEEYQSLSYFYPKIDNPNDTTQKIILLELVKQCGSSFDESIKNSMDTLYRHFHNWKGDFGSYRMLLLREICHLTSYMIKGVQEQQRGFNEAEIQLINVAISSVLSAYIKLYYTYVLHADTFNLNGVDEQLTIPMLYSEDVMLFHNEIIEAHGSPIRYTDAFIKYMKMKGFDIIQAEKQNDIEQSKPKQFNENSAIVTTNNSLALNQQQTENVVYKQRVIIEVQPEHYIENGVFIRMDDGSGYIINRELFIGMNDWFKNCEIVQTECQKIITYLQSRIGLPMVYQENSDDYQVFNSAIFTLMDICEDCNLHKTFGLLNNFMSLVDEYQNHIRFAFPIEINQKTEYVNNHVVNANNYDNQQIIVIDPQLFGLGRKICDYLIQLFHEDPQKGLNNERVYVLNETVVTYTAQIRQAVLQKRMYMLFAETNRPIEKAINNIATETGKINNSVKTSSNGVSRLMLAAQEQTDKVTKLINETSDHISKQSAIIDNISVDISKINGMSNKIDTIGWYCQSIYNGFKNSKFGKLFFK